MVFQVSNNGGFIEVASDGVSFEAHIQPTNRSNLFVLTSGQICISAAEVFEGDAIDRLLAQLKEKFDFIIFDAAPVVQFPDAFALASKVDSIILVAESEKTSIEDAQRAKYNLEQAGGRILGVVLNRQKDYTPAFLKKFFRVAN
jgi:capsular exopolysaccharide synthesis family protein